MTTSICLVNDDDCVHNGSLRRELCDRHYVRLTRFGTTEPVHRKPASAGRTDATMRNVEVLLQQCRLGKEPAESLPSYARDWLVRDLVTKGWTDVEIAAHTRMTTYTTGRIRERLGLAPNNPASEAA